MSDNGRVTWTNERRRLSELIPWPINPAQISKEAAKRLEESLDEFGQVQTIAISPANEIYDGHQRKLVWGASSKFGKDYEVDVRVSSRELTEQERKKLVIYLRKGAVGEFDSDMLANHFELDDLLEWGFERKDLDLDLWAGEPAEDPGAQIDKADELRQKWGVESGQLWQLGEHRLICGDCTDRAVVERVMGGEKADCLFTDPPYNVNMQRSGSIAGDNQTPDEYSQFTDIWQSNASGILSDDCATLVFIGFQEYPGMAKKLRKLFDELNCIVWAKPSIGLGGLNGGLRYQHEFIWFGGKKKVNDKSIGDLWSFDRDNTTTHPTLKPLPLVEKGLLIIECEIIYDPFLGSGTTLIACERLGRKCRAVEISPAYCAVAIQRWVDLTGGEPVVL